MCVPASLSQVDIQNRPDPYIACKIIFVSDRFYCYIVVNCELVYSSVASSCFYPSDFAKR